MDDVVRDYLKEIGKRGGTTTKERYGKNHLSQAGKKGMASRWGEKKESLEKRNKNIVDDYNTLLKSSGATPTQTIADLAGKYGLSTRQVRRAIQSILDETSTK